MKEIDNIPIESFDQDWGNPDGTGKKAKSLEQVQAFLKKHMNNGYKYISTVTPSTTPVTLTGDEKVFYIATEEGDYTNFGLEAISELSVIKSDKGSWKVEGLGVPLNIDENITQLDTKYELEISKLKNNRIDLNLDFNSQEGGYINANTSGGISGGGGQMKCTLDYYPVNNGDIIVASVFASTNDCIAFYDSNKQYVRRYNCSSTNDNPTVVRITIEQDGYLRFSNNYAYYASPSAYKENQESNLEKLQEETDELDSRVTDEISKLKNNRIDLNLDFNSQEGGYINANTSGGISGGGGQTKCTLDYYPVNNGDIIVASVFASTNDCIAFYDSNKQYVRRYNCSSTNDNPTVVRITIEQDGYLRFSNNYAYYASPGAYKENQESNLEKLQEETDELDSRVTEIEKYISIELDCSNLLQGLLNGKTGGVGFSSGDYPNYRYCPTYFAVKKGNVINTNVSCTGSYAALCFYNINKQIVSSIEKGTTDFADITVPDNDNIAYVRLCTECYQVTQNISAFIKSKKTILEIEDLENRVEDLENRVEDLEESGVNVDENNKPYFNIDKDVWIADEISKTYSPSSPKIEHKYVGQVNPSKRFIALGFDDFRASDFSFIIPLLDKYAARAVFNRVHRSNDETLTDKQRVNSVINGRHELGDHTWYHYKYPFFEPLFNGQNPDSPDGNQVPFPSNSQLRDDVGDGKNIFGKVLTHIVKDDLGYLAPEINVSWAEMTDEQCQYFRNYYSVMWDTTNLILVFDTLSNKYLGTEGSSRNSWDDNDGEYKGGIFTGCKTSQNHEIWERILQVTNMYFKDVFRLNYNLITWSLPGSKSSGCYFKYDNILWFDELHTKRYGNLARFTSSLYKNQDGTAKERSWTEVLREFGYKTTHDTSPSSGSYCMSYQFLLNAKGKRIDALPHNTNRSISYSTIASEYTKGTDLTGTKPLEVQMYDGGGSFKTAIETWRKMSANGLIWGEVIDSQDTWSERMILEGLCKYCDKVGIELITKAEAFDICFNHQIINGNLIYNPTFRNTAKEFMPLAETVPTNPDGFVGNCSVSSDGNVPVLIMGTGNTYYNHFGIPYGKLKLSAEVKGNGTITVYEIKNNTLTSDLNNISNLHTIGTITSLDNSQFVNKEIEFEILDNDITDYEQVFEGMGDKIIGVKIVFSAGLEIKNLDMRKI